jgi:glycosyltransferase involved in cell wall biosynthesis
MAAPARMTGAPRTVFGMVAYGRADALARTLESLLAQTRRDFAIVVSDDRPLPEIRAIVERYAADGRIVYEPNAARLGMVGNKRRVFARSRALFPDSEYFAWVSDHDIWHPRWLEVLAGLMDGRPEVMLAYPQMMRVFRKHRRRIGGSLDTAGMPPLDRMRIATTMLTAGNGIYGLFRARALARVGGFRPVLLPDRQLIVAVSLYGDLVQVPEVLWYREVAGSFSYDRQRRMLFAGRAPLHTRLPIAVQHAGVLFWDLAVRGRGGPQIGRLAGLKYAVAQVRLAAQRDALRAQERRHSRSRGAKAPTASAMDEPAASESPTGAVVTEQRVKTGA